MAFFDLSLDQLQTYKPPRNEPDDFDAFWRDFDGVNFATRANASALFSTALMDTTCPPSTVFAAYNYYAGPKQIMVYEFNQHDGGGIHQFVQKLEFLHALWQ